MARNKTNKLRKPLTNQQSYPKLREVWYAKLARSGFEDIELDEMRFKRESPSSRVNLEHKRSDIYAKSEYYSIAGQFLHNYRFASPLEKVIWEYHANAISVRNIAKLLKKVKTKMKPNKDNIAAIVKKLVREMKRMYLVGYQNE